MTFKQFLQEKHAELDNVEHLGHWYDNLSRNELVNFADEWMEKAKKKWQEGLPSIFMFEGKVYYYNEISDDPALLKDIKQIIQSLEDRLRRNSPSHL